MADDGNPPLRTRPHAGSLAGRTSTPGVRPSTQSPDQIARRRNNPEGNPLAIPTTNDNGHGDTHAAPSKNPSHADGADGAVMTDINFAQQESRLAAEKARQELRREADKMRREVAALVGEARAAQEAWQATPIAQRIEAVRKLRAIFLARAEELANATHASVGKPATEAMFSEVLPCLEAIEFWSSSITPWLADEPVVFQKLHFRGKRGRTRMLPRGVLALITPWNFPIWIPVRTAIPALLAGNAVVHKPSEVAPAVSQILQEIFDAALPKGLYLTLQGGGIAGEALTQADVDAVFFTGSTVGGKRIAHAAAARFVPCALELGGKDAAIVLDDADLERTCRGIAWAAFNNAGQNRASIERAYVVDAIYDRFVAKMREVARAIPKENIGPLVSRMHYQFVIEQIDDALHHGALLVYGNERDDVAHRVSPTILSDVAPDAPILSTETFGPVLPIVRVQNEDDAIILANHSDYGLNTSIWSSNLERARALAHRATSGMVAINNHGFTAAAPHAPWTGHKNSGQGITNSRHALQYMVRPQLMLEDVSTRPDFWWFPYNSALDAVMARLLDFFRAGPFGRFNHLFALAGLWRTRFLPASTDATPKKPSMK